MTYSYLQLQEKLGYVYKKPELLQQALRHSSCGLGNSERLEFLGDALLDAVIAELLYEKYPAAHEGELTRRRAHIVNRDGLALVASNLSLGDYITLGDGELRTGGREKASILAPTVEALLASVYLDGGWNEMFLLVKRLFAGLIGAGCQEKDAKTQLQEFLQARKMTLPIYDLIANTASDGNFTVTCRVDGLGPVFARGGTRRKAEQQAASAVLALLKNGQLANL